MINKSTKIKIGDLVVIKKTKNRQSNSFAIGIVISWYDSPKNLVEVMWWLDGGRTIERHPIVANRLEVINE